MNQINLQHPNAETYVQTPIGQLKFYSTAIGGSVEKATISQDNVSQSLSEGMRSVVTIAILLNFSVIEPIEEFRFCCKWENLKTSGYGCSGEGLDAWEWEDENYIVIVGTEDPVYLKLRIPSVPDEPFDPSYYPVTMAENEVIICLKKLPIGKSYSLHYVVAWNNLPEPEGSFCWLNVDLPHQFIRKLLPNSSFNDSSL
jgi:hypothetical protein